MPSHDIALWSIVQPRIYKLSTLASTHIHGGAISSITPTLCPQCDQVWLIIGWWLTTLASCHSLSSWWLSSAYSNQRMIRYGFIVWLGHDAITQIHFTLRFADQKLWSDHLVSAECKLNLCPMKIMGWWLAAPASCRPLSSRWSSSAYSYPRMISYESQFGWAMTPSPNSTSY